MQADIAPIAQNEVSLRQNALPLRWTSEMKKNSWHRDHLKYAQQTGKAYKFSNVGADLWFYASLDKM